MISKGLILALLVSAPLAAQEHPEQYAAADVAAGSRIYNARCVSCHSPSGAGVGGIDLWRGRSPRTATDAALGSTITTGVPGTGMPAFDLDADELRAVIAFIRAGFEPADAKATGLPPGDAARGRIVFEGAGKCLSCHRVHDRGAHTGPDLTDVGAVRTPVGILRSLVNPTGGMRPINRPVRAVLRDGSVVQGRRLNEDTYTVQIVNDQGRLVSLVKAELRDWSVSATSPMPSYKDTLPPADLADVVAYLVSLKGSQQ